MHFGGKKRNNRAKKKKKKNVFASFTAQINLKKKNLHTHVYGLTFFFFLTPFFAILTIIFRDF
jgi:hypothetical protein